jgi:predicted DNA-binding transcriptional regulator AlpA
MQAAKLLSAREVAQLLGVSIQTLAVWRCEQRYPLAYVKVGSRVRYRPCDVEQFMAARLTIPNQG